MFRNLCNQVYGWFRDLAILQTLDMSDNDIRTKELREGRKININGFFEALGKDDTTDLKLIASSLSAYDKELIIEGFCVFSPILNPSTFKKCLEVDFIGKENDGLHNILNNCIILSAYRDNIDALMALENCRTDCNFINGYTLLHLALDYANSQKVNPLFLKTPGFHNFTQSTDNCRPYSKIEMIKKLLSAKDANLTLTNSEGRTFVEELKYTDKLESDSKKEIYQFLQNEKYPNMSHTDQVTVDTILGKSLSSYMEYIDQID